MTKNRILFATEHFKKEIPKECMSTFITKLQAAPDSCLDELMMLKLKKRWLVILFSIFLGAFSVDRFYIGDVSNGIWKIVLRVGAVIANMISSLISAAALAGEGGAGLALIVSIIGFVLSIASTIWCFVDIFVCYKRVKESNYSELLGCIFSSDTSRNYWSR